MSDILKAQTSPQFNWYNKWTHLDADGMPDKTIEEGLKQPDRIKVSFTVHKKDCTGLVVPDQARFGPEYFLAYTLPDFESRILGRIPEDKRNDVDTLFMLMEQCFQGVGLTKWTNVVANRCKETSDRTKDDFVECQRDYLEAVAGFPNIGDQLIRWLRTAKKPALMPIHEYMRRRVQLFSYLEKGLLRCTMELPTAQERAEQIFLGQPKMHQMKYAETHKTVPADVVPLVAFFEQCHNADRASGLLDKLKKGKKKVDQETDRKKASTTRDQGRKKHNYRDARRSSRERYHDRKYHDRKRYDESHRNSRRHDHREDKHPRRHDRDRDHRKISDGNKNHRDKDRKKEDHAMHADERSKSRSYSRSRSSSRSRSVSIASRASSERSLDNNHVDTRKPDGVVPSAARKRNLSYSDDEYDERIHAQSKDETLFATFAAPNSKKGKKTRKTSK